MVALKVFLSDLHVNSQTVISSMLIWACALINCFTAAQLCIASTLLICMWLILFTGRDVAAVSIALPRFGPCAGVVGEVVLAGVIMGGCGTNGRFCACCTEGDCAASWLSDVDVARFPVPNWVWGSSDVCAVAAGTCATTGFACCCGALLQPWSGVCKHSNLSTLSFRLIFSAISLSPWIFNPSNSRFWCALSSFSICRHTFDFPWLPLVLCKVSKYSP